MLTQYRGGEDNAYSYVNDPINASDFSGQSWLSSVVSAVVSVAKTVVHAAVSAVVSAAKVVVATVAHVVNTIVNSPVVQTIVKAVTKTVTGAPKAVSTAVSNIEKGTTTLIVQHPAIAIAAGVGLGILSLATGIGEVAATIGVFDARKPL